MAQSLGPLTVLIQMLKIPDPTYRKKWEDAVKSQMGLISCIDDIISLSKEVKKVTDLAPIISLLGDILLISTSRQIRRMFFPLAMMVATLYPAGKFDEEMIKRFNVSSHGGYHVYDEACRYKWSINGKMNDVHASQIVFHSIFGTYSEDMGVLSEITNVGKWCTREELGKSFQSMGDSSTTRTFSLPKFSIYSKLSSANQNTSLAGVYEQVTYAPVFVGFRQHSFSPEFLNYMQKTTSIQKSGKTISEIVSALSEINQELQNAAREGNLDGLWGTVHWFDMSTVATNCSKTLSGVIKDKTVTTRNNNCCIFDKNGKEYNI